jgi:hypothetical protein
MTASDEPLCDRIAAIGRFSGKGIYAKAQSRKGAKREERKTDVTGNEVAKIVVDAAYYPGKKRAHVGQAFQPDLSFLSGWKA